MSLCARTSSERRIQISVQMGSVDEDLISSVSFGFKMLGKFAILHFMYFLNHSLMHIQVSSLLK